MTLWTKHILVKLSLKFRCFLELTRDTHVFQIQSVRTEWCIDSVPGTEDPRSSNEDSILTSFHIRVVWFPFFSRSLYVLTDIRDHLPYILVLKRLSIVNIILIRVLSTKTVYNVFIMERHNLTTTDIMFLSSMTK